MGKILGRNDVQLVVREQKTGSSLDRRRNRRDRLWFTEFMAAPQSRVWLWTFARENCKTYQVGRENKRLGLLPGKSIQGVKNKLCKKNMQLSLSLLFLGPGWGKRHT